jgi:hypothetical protein
VSYLVAGTSDNLNGVEWCFASGGIFRWETCEKSNEEVANALNNLNSGSLSNDVGNEASSTSLASKFDILISALLGANTGSNATTFSLYVDLIGTDIPTSDDRRIVCQIVSSTLANQLNIDVKRVTCSLDEQEEAKAADRTRYLATMGVKPADTLKPNGVDTSGSSPVGQGTFAWVSFVAVLIAMEMQKRS